MPPFGLNVIGFTTGNFGLSVAVRNTIRLLLEEGHALAVVDVEAGGGRSGHDSTFDSLVDRRRPAPYPVNLFHMNPPDVVNLMIDRPRWLDLKSNLNVCVPFWELPKLPPGAWTEVLESCDLVLCPTRYVMDTVQTSAPGARCIHYPQTVHVPDPVAPDRARWGIPEQATVFLVSLDLGSDVDRKNPWGSIDAFKAAFGDDSDARLVIKLNNPDMDSRSSSATARIRELTRAMTNVDVVTGRMSYEDTLSLYASCDVLSSLHRAEGLGLHLLEAMMLGKPVIATGWSGNMDFMDADSACLVGYDLVPVRSEHPSYREDVIGDGQLWAEPKVDEASAWMRRLAGDDALRAEIGLSARLRAAQTQSDPERSAAISAIREILADGGSLSPEHRERAEKLASLRRVSLARRIRRRGGRLLRAIGLRR